MSNRGGCWFVKAKRAQSVTDDESWKEGGVSPTLNSFDNNSETRATVVATAQYPSWTGGAQQDQFVAGDDVSPTIAHASNHHGGHHEPKIVTPELGVRRLTPRECERLQGWPDDHTRYTADGKEVPDSARYRMVGNGVAAPVAKYVAECIEAILGDSNGR